jgi:uncharacterized protein with NRDE domain
VGDQVKQRAAIVEAINGKHADLEQAVNAFNAAITEHFEKVQAAVDAYNESVSDAQSFMEEVATDIRSYIEDRSEKWQESDKGQEYSGWADEWEGTLDTAEIGPPEEIEVPDNVAPTFEDIAEEVEAV